MSTPFYIAPPGLYYFKSRADAEQFATAHGFASGATQTSPTECSGGVWRVPATLTEARMTA